MTKDNKRASKKDDKRSLKNSSKRSEVTVKTLCRKYDKKIAIQYEKEIYEACDRASKKLKITIHDAYQRYCYQMVGELMMTDDPDKILKYIKSNFKDQNREGYDSVFYDSAKKSIKLLTKKALTKPVAIKGKHICKKIINKKVCNSDEFYYWTAQTRGSDEGSTQFRSCAKCSAESKE